MTETHCSVALPAVISYGRRPSESSASDTLLLSVKTGRKFAAAAQRLNNSTQVPAGTTSKKMNKSSCVSDLGMGQTLSEPITTKESTALQNSQYKVKHFDLKLWLLEEDPVSIGACSYDLRGEWRWHAYHMMCFVRGHVDQLFALNDWTFQWSDQCICLDKKQMMTWRTLAKESSQFSFYKATINCGWKLDKAILLSLSRLFEIGNSLALSLNFANFFSVLFKYFNLVMFSYPVPKGIKIDWAKVRAVKSYATILTA